MGEDKEKKVAEEEQAAAEPAEKKGKKRLPIILGVIIVVIAIAGIGFWKWHEQPTFCNAICHNMDSFVETYYAEPGAAATDKWGNEVTNSNAMLAVTHAQSGVNCLGCHVPSLGQQMSEGMEFVTGNYEMPLKEKSVSQLLEGRGEKAESGDQFCLRDGCHEMITREVLTEATAEMKFNPHRWQHGEIECSECHKSHRASVFYCTQCHQEAESSMPDGWVNYTDAQALQEAATGK
ncbi:MAG: cytochrome c3 family protein [Eggerthellaceae bacterium]|nr:cytochrome c3 family protein [Eggerthellaceae bacterium]